jgi:hypothetical protein
MRGAGGVVGNANREAYPHQRDAGAADASDRALVHLHRSQPIQKGEAMSKSLFLDNDFYAHMMQKDDLIVVKDNPERDPATMQPFANINGFQFVMDEWAPKSMRVQFRKPRSKKRRVQKKWVKDPRNWKMVNVAWIVDTSKIRTFYPPKVGLMGLPYYRGPVDEMTQFITGLERAARPILFGDGKL